MVIENDCLKENTNILTPTQILKPHQYRESYCLSAGSQKRTLYFKEHPNKGGIVIVIVISIVMIESLDDNTEDDLVLHCSRLEIVF